MSFRCFTLLLIGYAACQTAALGLYVVGIIKGWW